MNFFMESWDSKLIGFIIEYYDQISLKFKDLIKENIIQKAKGGESKLEDIEIDMEKGEEKEKEKEEELRFEVAGCDPLLCEQKIVPLFHILFSSPNKSETVILRRSPQDLVELLKVVKENFKDVDFNFLHFEVPKVLFLFLFLFLFFSSSFFLFFFFFFSSSLFFFFISSFLLSQNLPFFFSFLFFFLSVPKGIMGSKTLDFSFQKMERVTSDVENFLNLVGRLPNILSIPNFSSFLESRAVDSSEGSQFTVWRVFVTAGLAKKEREEKRKRKRERNKGEKMREKEGIFF